MRFGSSINTVRSLGFHEKAKAKEFKVGCNVSNMLFTMWDYRQQLSLSIRDRVVF